MSSPMSVLPANVARDVGRWHQEEALTFQTSIQPHEAVDEVRCLQVGVAFVHEPLVSIASEDVVPTDPTPACLDLKPEGAARRPIQDEYVDLLRGPQSERAIQAPQGKLSQHEELSSQRDVVGGRGAPGDSLPLVSLSTLHRTDIHMCIAFSATVMRWTLDACWLSRFGAPVRRPASLKPKWPEPSGSASRRSTGSRAPARTPPCERCVSCAERSSVSRVIYSGR